MKKICYMLLLSLFFIIPANAGVIGFAKNSLWYSAPDNVHEGQSIKIYANLVNNEYTSFEGDLAFYANNEPIGKAISFKINEDESRLFNVIWIAKSGDVKFSAKILNPIAYDNKNEKQNLTIDIDTSSANLFIDSDTDNDGLYNKEEAAKGTDPLVADTDGDGYNDKEDTAPLDSHIFPGPDTDGDGISDRVDTDIDNDGLYNWQEKAMGTDPTKKDSDGDGVNDKEDAAPTNPKIWNQEQLVIPINQTKPTTENSNSQPVKKNDTSAKKILINETPTTVSINQNDIKNDIESESKKNLATENKIQPINKDSYRSWLKDNYILTILIILTIISFIKLISNFILFIKTKNKIPPAK